MRRLFLDAVVATICLCLCLAGCAGATGPGDDVGEVPDASVSADTGPAPDAGADPLTLSQSNALTVTAGNSMRCGTGAVSYYRTFNLASYTTLSFHANTINLGVEAVTGTPTIALRLHTLVGSMSTNNMTLLHEESVPVSMQGTVVSIPLAEEVYVPGASLLVVEVAIPDDDAFLIGSNNAGQTGPSYVRWPGCGQTQPVMLGAGVHIVLTVDGTTP